MSVQFGRWNFDGQPVQPEYIEKVNALLAPYGPDGGSSYSASGLAILYHAFHTTKESCREKQLRISNSGAVITWDGRLDNRADLIRELSDAGAPSSTDVEIAAAAYEEWAEKSFARLIGDWAAAIWNPVTRSLVLAKDPIGTRHLYYAVEEQGITWSTILDPLVMLAGRKFQLCEEYIAGWLGFFPATYLTPYVGIDSVPPSSFVRLQPGKREIRRYWDFDPHKRIRYQTDGEYEEHFRTVFAESVRRRLRSDTPILAELSGGMDSSSIVCMADTLLAQGACEAPRLDTLSYYDDSEPNWNEKPYFMKVEERRGRRGWRIDVESQTLFRVQSERESFAATPASAVEPSEIATHFAQALTSTGSRVLLSGIGGDEVTGGVPTPTPELMDLLQKGRFTPLAGQLKRWALDKRRPWFYLLVDAVRHFLPLALPRPANRTLPLAWLEPDFVRQNWTALTGYASRIKLFGPAPSFQENLSTLDLLRRQLCCFAAPLSPCYERSYPYLDRTLLEFLYQVPREQVVRPGQRRSLMRRSLVGIVPDEIINRKRKAFVARAPTKAVSLEWADVLRFSENMLTASMGIINPKLFRDSLIRAQQGCEIPIVTLLRVFAVESWLGAASVRHVLRLDRRSIGAELRVHEERGALSRDAL